MNKPKFKCPAISDYCHHCYFKTDRNNEIAVTYCTHSRNLLDEEGNTTRDFCPILNLP